MSYFNVRNITIVPDISKLFIDEVLIKKENKKCYALLTVRSIIFKMISKRIASNSRRRL